ncbi:MAG: MotA/TolQ/ExbB proton channel family protein [Planctomycetota bacterium]|nr:MotA/TolQ/ExbB proton channel family protein [Planctomycetota bacterium]MEC8734714.1 MotA/TolQ/ExbB proton channel family protein [Planctomycetota bacterium]MEC9156861.1 MotA/TolQ/ExbB proton channel family protein [Planctomycetota bacterium]MED5506437.1 MotA/TolQ/ExbB proton channel family protein [Planctomycetota bacterium]
MGDLLQRLGELMDQGGFVMWPLLFMSIFTIALSFERLVFWLRVNSSARLRFGKFMSALHVGSTARVRDIAAKDDSPYGELADRLAQGEGDADSISVEVVEYQRPRIERYMLVFSTIVTAAPMLGILGTVLGIIRSFELLGAQETITDPREISAGIAEALLTTAFGLVVALIALVPYMACRGQIERAICRFEAMTAAARGKFVDPSSD